MRLTLANFRSDYELSRPPVEVWPLQGELDRIAREQLPQLLSDCLLPDIGPDGSVIRVRHLHVDLAVNRGNVNNGVLARLWARQILQSLLSELRHGGDGNVARFASHAHFAASFISDLLLGRAWESWVYQEFSPLRHLSSGEAIAELLSARPGFFALVAAHLLEQNTAERLLNTLTERQALQILAALEQSVSTAPPVRELFALGQRMSRVLDAGSLRHGPASLRRIHFLMRMAAELSDEDDLSPALMLSRHLALVQEFLLAQPLTGAQRLLEAIAPAGNAESSLLRALPGELLQILVECRTQEPGESYLDWLVRCAGELTPQASPITARGQSPWPPAATPLPAPPFRGRGQEGLLPPCAAGGRDGLPEPTALPIQAQPNRSCAEASADVGAVARSAGPMVDFASAFAGYGLLLMTIKDLKLTSRLTMAQLRGALVATVEEQFRRLCELDPLWGALFPVGDPDQPTPPCPAVDDEMTEGLSDEWKEAILELSAEAGWGSLVIHRFASRLPGLGGSSVGYLRRQFLQRSGRVQIDAGRVTLSLDSMPLAIVLRMAGMSGWQGRLPWLEQRELFIEIPAG